MDFLGIDLIALIVTVGYAGLFTIIFAESGVLIGLFLPGDSLLFAAGILASQGLLDIRLLLPLFAAAAILGDSFGYWTGKKLGPRLFTREDSLLFKKKHVARAKAFYDRHGPKAIVLARFIPFVRTLAPVVAGIAEMHYPTFLKYNILGGLVWSLGITLLGYALGSLITDIEAALLPIIGAIILVSFLPAIVEWMRHRAHGKSADRGLRQTAPTGA